MKTNGMECRGGNQLETHCKHPASKVLGIGAVFSRNKPILVHFFFSNQGKMSDLALLKIKNHQ